MLVWPRSSWPMLLETQPFLMLTCDGCGHCGAGVPGARTASIMEQFAAALASWGITAPPASAGDEPKQGVDGTVSAFALQPGARTADLGGARRASSAAPARPVAGLALAGAAVLSLGLLALRARSGPRAAEGAAGRELEACLGPSEL
mmetsp:Transcript_46200/g.147643  ORF Transcript_46200/g.147643 Transcript_46200/m.147643 type:complete len:147 (-) Transcript_46200:49-489(-)